MATTELNNSNWEEFSKSDFAVIDCYGENCFACVILAPILEGIADELSGVKFGRINISFETEIADKFRIDAMPTLLYFRKGELVDTTVGSMEREELLQHISKLLYQ